MNIPKADIRDLIAQHREGMKYLSELGAYIHDMQQGKNIQHLRGMDGWFGDTVDSVGNSINATYQSVLNNYRNATSGQYNTAQTVDMKTGKVTTEAINGGNVIFNTEDAIHNAAQAIADAPGAALNVAKPWIVYGAVGVAVIVLLPHVLDYMSASKRRRI